MNFGRVFAVFKKEMRRFFADKRMLAALFMPGVLIFVIYMVMGKVVTSLIDGSGVEKSYSYRIAINEDEEGGKFVPVLLSYFETVKQEEPTITYYPNDELASMKTSLREDKIDSLLFFAFDEEGAPTSIQAYYNGESEASETLYSVIPSLVDLAYKPYSFNDGINPNLGEKSYASISIMGFILPMITVSLLYSSVISICPESIAGEKERGTLLSLLATPIKPLELACGKLLALSLVALLSGSWNAACTLASAPNLFGGTELGISSGGYALFFFAILSLLLLFVSMATLISALSKSTKEANGYLGPLTAVMMVLAIIPSFADVSGLGYAFVPFLGSVQCLKLISSGSYDLLYSGMSILSNLVLAGVFAALTSLTFKSERMVGN